jgi:hypothetical protein
MCAHIHACMSSNRGRNSSIMMPVQGRMPSLSDISGVSVVMLHMGSELQLETEDSRVRVTAARGSTLNAVQLTKTYTVYSSSVRK